MRQHLAGRPEPLERRGCDKSDGGGGGGGLGEGRGGEGRGFFLPLSRRPK